MNLPNALTLTRIFLVPLIVAILLTKLPGQWSAIPLQILGASLFFAASVTDALDGYFARRRGQVSTLGILLDPIADKLLVASAFIALVEARLAPAWAVAIIVGREFAVSGLRSIAASEGFTISASKMGKFKMLTQVFAITCLILGSRTVVEDGAASIAPPVSTEPNFAGIAAMAAAFADLLNGNPLTSSALQIIIFGFGRVMLWVVVFTALWSMVDYFHRFYGKIRDQIQVRERRGFRVLKRRPRPNEA